MSITVTYFGQLRHVAGAETERVEVVGPMALPDALAGLAARHGEDFTRIVFDDGHRVRPSLMVLVNGAVVAKGSAPVLKEGDEVTLLPAIAGG